MSENEKAIPYTKNEKFLCEKETSHPVSKCCYAGIVGELGFDGWVKRCGYCGKLCTSKRIYNE